MMQRTGTVSGYFALLAALLAGSAGHGLAQATAAPPASERLVNLDTLAMPAQGDSSVLLDVRQFGAAENNTYVGLQLGYASRSNLEFVLRGMYGSKRQFIGDGFAIQHGGSDVELLAKWRQAPSSKWGAALGLSYPDTAGPRRVYGTAQFLLEQPAGDSVTFHLTPKAIFGSSSSIAGVGAGVTVKLGRALQVLGDITAIVGGHNTFSTITGEGDRAPVWALSLRYTPPTRSRELAFDLGVTNGLGGTTAMGLSSGLSGSCAVMLGLTYGFREEH